MPSIYADPAPTADSDLAACRKLLRGGSKSFFAASLLLPKRVRGPAEAFYAFCRVADDVVDQKGGRGAMPSLHRRLALIFQGQPIPSPVDRSFARVVAAHSLPREVMDALLEGFAWDAEGRRYPDLSALRSYAARVASTVGTIMTLLMGRRNAFVLARACDLGVAMQLTNIARDVGEDARAGRVYLPLDWLDEAGIRIHDWLPRPEHHRSLGAVVERLLRYADGLYARANLGIPMLPLDCQPAIRAASLIYRDIGQEVQHAGFDSVSRRAVVPQKRKLWLLARALMPLTAILSDGEGQVFPTYAEAPPLDETRFLVEAACRADPRPNGPPREF